MSGLQSFFKGWAKTFKKANAWAKILSKAETASAGSRAWPTDRGQDKSVGMRIDWGELFEENGKRMRNLCLQPNADADNATIKQKANKSTHQNLGVVAIDVDNPPEENEAMELLRESIDKWGFGMTAFLSKKTRFVSIIIIVLLRNGLQRRISI